MYFVAAAAFRCLHSGLVYALHVVQDQVVILGLRFIVFIVRFFRSTCSGGTNYYPRRVHAPRGCGLGLVRALLAVRLHDLGCLLTFWCVAVQVPCQVRAHHVHSLVHGLRQVVRIRLACGFCQVVQLRHAAYAFRRTLANFIRGCSCSRIIVLLHTGSAGFLPHHRSGVALVLVSSAMRLARANLCIVTLPGGFCQQGVCRGGSPRAFDKSFMLVRSFFFAVVAIDFLCCAILSGTSSRR